MKTAFLIFFNFIEMPIFLFKLVCAGTSTGQLLVVCRHLICRFRSAVKSFDLGDDDDDDDY